MTLLLLESPSAQAGLYPWQALREVNQEIQSIEAHGTPYKQGKLKPQPVQLLSLMTEQGLWHRKRRSREVASQEQGLCRASITDQPCGLEQVTMARFLFYKTEMAGEPQLRAP